MADGSPTPPQCCSQKNMTGFEPTLCMVRAVEQATVNCTHRRYERKAGPTLWAVNAVEIQSGLGNPFQEEISRNGRFRFLFFSSFPQPRPQFIKSIASLPPNRTTLLAILNHASRLTLSMPLLKTIITSAPFARRP